jgi:integrase
MLVKLTDRFVDTAKPKSGEARTDYWDTAKGSRLGLRVSAKSKVWMIMYRRASDGSKRRYRLGTYPALSLSDARKAASAVVAKVDSGQDPAGERDIIKAESTFKELSEIYLEKHAKIKLRSWQEEKRRLNASILPAIGSMRASQVSDRDVIRLHDHVTDRGAPVEANRQVALIRRVYSWAISKRLLKVNPAEKLEWNSEKPRARVLDKDELVQFWHGLENASAAPATKLALKILLLTGQRAGEITGCLVSEINLDRAVWNLPGERTKNGEAHTVPLSPWVCELFAAAIENERNGFVFPARSGEAPMTRRALSRVISRNYLALGMEQFTPHDLRRTAASQMAAAGVDRLVIAKVLNHRSGDRDSVTGLVYDRYDYESEKRCALGKWANRLADIVDSGTGGKPKVVHLR